VFKWLGPASGRIVALVNVAQAHCWWLGVFDACTALVAAYQYHLILMVGIYCFFVAIVWDSERFRMRQRYADRLKGASRRGKRRL
jgi:hypothetical protein